MAVTILSGCPDDHNIPHVTRWIQMFRCIFSPPSFLKLMRGVQKQVSSVRKSIFNLHLKISQCRESSRKLHKAKRSLFKKISSFYKSLREKDIHITTDHHKNFRMGSLEADRCFVTGWGFFTPLFRHLLKSELDKYFRISYTV